MTQINTTLADQLAQVVVNKAIENGDLPATPKKKVSAKSPRARKTFKPTPKTEGTKEKETTMKLTTTKATKKAIPTLDPKNPTIEAVACHCLSKGMGTKDTLTRVLAVFPGAKTTVKCIYYYASQYGFALRQGAVANSKALKALMKEIA